MKRTTLFFPEKMIEQLKDEAKEKGISYAELVRHIIFSYFEEDDKNA